MANVVPPAIVGAVVVVVVVMVAATFLAQFFVDGYRPETAIYGMGAAVVTYVLATGRKGGGE